MSQKWISIISAALALSAICSVTEPRAAEIKIASLDFKGNACNVALSGDIVVGDAVALKRVIDSLHTDSMLGGNYVELCLNSNGGLWTEALQMAKIVHQNGIGTMIEGESHCHSACSIIFMAGTAIGRHFMVPYRFLDASAVLSFHAPYLRSNSPRDSVGNDAAVFQSAIKAIANLTAIFDNSPAPKGQYWIRPSLLSRMLAKGPSESFQVATTNDAGRLDINIIGLVGVNTETITPSMLAYACWNYIWWGMDLEPPSNAANDLISRFSRKTINEFGQPEIVSEMTMRINQSGYFWPTCKIKYMPNVRATDNLASIVVSNVGSGEDDWTSMPSWWMVPGNTPLRNLVGK